MTKKLCLNCKYRYTSPDDRMFCSLIEGPDWERPQTEAEWDAFKLTGRSIWGKKLQVFDGTKCKKWVEWEE